MPNQIPLSTATDAAGGYIVPPSLRDALQDTIARKAAALNLANKEYIDTNRAEWPIYKGRPTVAGVAEAGTKQVTGAEFGLQTAKVKKVATIIRYTNEILQDARLNPQVLVNEDVEAAFADYIDKQLIGTHPGGANTQAYFDGYFANLTAANQEVLANTTQSIELGATADAFAIGVSTAIEAIEGFGGTPNGLLMALDMKGHLRAQRVSGTEYTPLYTDGFAREPESLYGLGLSITTNLDAFPFGVMGGAGSPGKVAAIIGDFTHARAIIRNAISVDVSREATVGGVSLWETNQTAFLWEMRMGFTIHDRDRMFYKVINAVTP